MRIKGKFNGEFEVEEMKLENLKRRDLEMSVLPWFSINGFHWISYLPQHKPKEGEIMAFPASDPVEEGKYKPIKLTEKEEKWLKEVQGTQPTFDFFCHTIPSIFVEVKSKNSPLNENQKELAEEIPFPLIVIEQRDSSIAMKEFRLDKEIDIPIRNVVYPRNKKGVE